MAKIKKIEVKGVSIAISERNKEDFVSLTDIANGFEGGNALIEKWLRNKNTLEFLAVWEQLYNPNFNSPEYEGIRSEAGSNRFVMSVKQWIQKTGALGITASAGRYGGTFAQKDIAIEFCAWISPEFKLLVIKEFQRLKQQEEASNEREWNLGRLLSKVNYRIHTEAIKESLIPPLQLPKEQQSFVYADEADLLNLALFGITARAWKSENSKTAEQGYNIRDFATIPQLIVLSNLESYNAIMIKKGIPQEERFLELQKIAAENLKTLESASLQLHQLQSPNLKLLDNKKDPK